MSDFEPSPELRSRAQEKVANREPLSFDTGSNRGQPWPQTKPTECV